MKEVTFEEFPPTWKPEKEGDMVEGRVVEFRTAQIDGKDRRLMVLETNKGGRRCPMAVWLNGVLEGKVRAGKVTDGVYIRIIYDGKRQSPVSRYQYNVYRLFRED